MRLPHRVTLPGRRRRAPGLLLVRVSLLPWAAAGDQAPGATPARATEAGMPPADDAGQALLLPSRQQG